MLVAESDNLSGHHLSYIKSQGWCSHVGYAAKRLLRTSSRKVFFFFFFSPLCYTHILTDETSYYCSRPSFMARRLSLLRPPSFFSTPGSLTPTGREIYHYSSQLGVL